ncbi:type IV pilin N-terminal domain-containing protein [uncultured Methanoculleus sp.]|jgi:FlaG/FlaF family flagellin (archaellin)|uniref:type IV pilin N-terminal domain-containing protein n=1 Tax=uncultured Methanoculleus sp. TaxID=183762 RepID=UPI00319DAB2E
MTVKQLRDDAVSPVVGIMLMLVITIIIAAIVSAFAGGMATGQSKSPQAKITGTFSISDGMTISHAGGDSLATKDLVFTIRDGPTFGANLEHTTETLNMSRIMVSTERGTGPMKTTFGAFYMVSFNPGDSVTIEPEGCTCTVLQPGVAPTNFVDYVDSDGYTYTGTQTAAWALCIRNQDSIGKSFILEVSDTAGHLISKSNVLIAA